jgi:hypothetical protein
MDDIGTALRQASFCVGPSLWRVGCVGDCGGHRWSLAVMYISLSINNVSRIEKKDWALYSARRIEM